MTELWKPVVGYENLYSVSSYGRIYSHHRNRMLSTPKTRKKKYIDVELWKNGSGKSFKVHRLVAEAFIPNPNNLPFINHKDEDKTNNCVGNLEWCTNEYNLNYGNAHKNQALSCSILTKEQIVECYNLFKSGKSIHDLGKYFNVSDQVISRALTKDRKYMYDGLENINVSYADIQKSGRDVAAVKHRKLSDEDVLKSYAKYKSGISLTQLSKDYDVSIATLSMIFNGKRRQSTLLEV